MQPELYPLEGHERFTVVSPGVPRRALSIYTYILHSPCLSQYRLCSLAQVRCLGETALNGAGCPEARPCSPEAAAPFAWSSPAAVVITFIRAYMSNGSQAVER